MIAGAAVCAASLAAGFAVRARLVRCGHNDHTWRVSADRPALSSRRWAGVGRWLLRTDRAAVSLAVWLMIVDTVLALAAPWPLKVVVDYGLGHQRFPPWLAGLHGSPPLALAALAAVGGLLLLVLSSVAGYLVAFLVGAVGERMSSRLRVSVVGQLLRAAPRSVSRFPLGELASRLGSDANRVSDTITSAIEALIPDLAVLAGMTVITAMLDWRLTLTVLGVIPLYVLAARLRNRSLHGAQQRSRARAGELSAFAADLLARIPAVHVFGRADSEIADYHRASTTAADAAVTALDASARFAPITDSLPGIALAAALIAGTAEVSARRLTIGGLLVFLAYLSSLTGPVRSLSQLSTSITRGAASRDRLSELFLLPVLAAGRESLYDPVPLVNARHHGARSARQRGQHGLPPAAPVLPGSRTGLGAAVEIAGVSYAHRPGQPVLSDACMRVAAGEFVCITGPSGAGKSTLLALMVRLADPDSGVIRIDGNDIAGLPADRLRRLVTLAPQDPWLHSGSIAANIAYGNPAASRGQIRAGADLAGVTSFARLLPGGLDAPVGEHGRQLSGGQQRRIAVARALVADTPVLLLDEPTAGLDQAAEIALISGLLDHAGGKTVVVVTHSARLVSLADRVLRLEHGSFGDGYFGRDPVHLGDPVMAPDAAFVADKRLAAPEAGKPDRNVLQHDA
ncbi:MAG: ABC transporter ATP-binding protein [Streptosporangiaceae bacterium]